MGLPIIQSFWAGSRLSVMEQLSIRSFLSQGHPFHLYTCGHVENVPEGTAIHSAEEILPPAGSTLGEAFAGQDNATAMSACFRFALLEQRGGWWSDLDNVCIRPIDFQDEHVLGYEREPDGRRRVGVGLMKASAGSPLMQDCRRRQQFNRAGMATTGEVGPQLLAEALEHVPVPVRIIEPSAFCPIDSWRVWQFIRERQIPERCYAIRLWSAKWRRERLNPDAVYDLECIYEQLKRRFGVRSPEGTGHGPGWTSIAKIRIRRFQSVQRCRQPMLRAA